MSEVTRKLRVLMDTPGIKVFPGIFNGFSARLVEQAGFKGAAISGAGVSESLLGWADRGILTFDENLRVCSALADCTSIPLIADADTGYGNAVNVHFTVRAFEKAGLAAISIEDQVWPKRCGHMSGKAVIAAAEMADKVKAAVDARRDRNFLIRARTDAAAIDGLSEAIDRLNLYAEAGADILFADALLSAEDIGKVAGSVKKPLSVNMGFGLLQRGTTPLLSPKQLEALGVSAVTYPRLLTAAALKGMKNALAAFSETMAADRITERPDLLASFDDINALMGLSELQELEKRFSGQR